MLVSDLKEMDDKENKIYERTSVLQITIIAIFRVVIISLSMIKLVNYFDVSQ